MVYKRFTNMKNALAFPSKDFSHIFSHRIFFIVSHIIQMLHKIFQWKNLKVRTYNFNYIYFHFKTRYMYKVMVYDTFIVSDYQMVDIWYKFLLCSLSARYHIFIYYFWFNNNVLILLVFKAIFCCNIYETHICDFKCYINTVMCCILTRSIRKLYCNCINTIRFWYWWQLVF